MMARPSTSRCGWIALATMGRFVGRPGGAPIVVPADVPHRLTITGTAERRSLALVLHDSPQPWAVRTHEHGWAPKGLCGSE